MSIVRTPHDELTAESLKTFLGAKDQIIKDIREGNFSIRQARSLADFFIRAGKYKDIDLNGIIIRDFLFDICDAFNNFTIQSELIPAIAYYDPVSLLPHSNRLIFFDMLDKPEITHTITMRNLFSANTLCLSPFYFNIGKNSYDIQLNFIFVSFRLSKVESGAFLIRLKELVSKVPKETYHSGSAISKLSFQYILNETELNESVFNGVLDYIAQANFKAMARTAYEDVLRQRPQEKPAPSPLIAHSLLTQTLSGTPASSATPTPTIL